MTTKAQSINQNYLNKMYDANEGSDKVFYRIREFWWPSFVDAFECSPRTALDALDLAMNQGQERLRKAAEEHAKSLGFTAGSAAHIQRVNQVLKSNTGKMFERFIALAIAYSLLKYESSYCVWSFTADLDSVSQTFSKDSLLVKVTLDNAEYSASIDADFVIFDPTSQDADFFLVSIKSTLKDRFHNVPFWNLLRHVAVSNALENVSAKNLEGLKRPRYIAICSDLAEEQPDFSAASGPRNMLCLDAALLDGAYVTASRAVGLGSNGAHIGHARSAPFFPLSTLVSHLAPNLPIAN